MRQSERRERERRGRDRRERERKENRKKKEKMRKKRKFELVCEFPKRISRHKREKYNLFFVFLVHFFPLVI